ncbi:MAG: enoyl-ACP reductase, partial [Trueperaceae bacterium]
MTEPATKRTRELDLVVYGATGYTGRLVARAVADRAPAGLRWALAGRDRARLEQVRSELSVDAELIVADAHDDAALA